MLICGKNGKEREEKETNSLYALKCPLKTVQKRTKMANKSLEKRISAAKEELKTVTKQRKKRCEAHQWRPRGALAPSLY